MTCNHPHATVEMNPKGSDVGSRLFFCKDCYGLFRLQESPLDVDYSNARALQLELDQLRNNIDKMMEKWGKLKAETDMMTLLAETCCPPRCEHSDLVKRTRSTTSITTWTCKNCKVVVHSMGRHQYMVWNNGTNIPQSWWGDTSGSNLVINTEGQWSGPSPYGGNRIPYPPGILTVSVDC